MFSAIDRFGAVPAKGFWNTRPISFARRCSGQYVISRPARRIRPLSTGKLPATALSSVDFPEPFVPTTMTKDAGSIVRSMPCSDRTSFGVPAKNVLRMSLTSSMVGSQLLPPPLWGRKPIAINSR